MASCAGIGPAASSAERYARIELGGGVIPRASSCTVTSQGVRHRVHLSPDNGFIFDCRAYNGCTCVVKWLDAYTAAGRRVAHEDWLAYGCSGRR